MIQPNRKRFPLVLMLLILCLLALGAISPALAQEGTPPPDTNPVTVSTAESPLVTPVTAGGTTIINNNPASPSAGSAATPSDATNPLYVVVVVILATLLVAAMVFGGYIVKFLATLVPPETASSIYESGMRMGLQVALNQASRTENPYDDEFFIELARRRGLEAVKDPITGEYDVRPLMTKAAAPSARGGTLSADPSAFLTSPTFPAG